MTLTKMLLPQLAESTEIDSLPRFLADDRWVFEQKLDGHRILLRSPGRDMPPTAITRNGTIYTRRLPKAIQDFRFPPGEWALDGELVGTKLYVFDLPVTPLGQAIHQGAPLYERRAMLETLLKSISHPFILVPQARTTEEKYRLADVAYKRNLEGLVIKRTDSVYRPGGRTAEWLKAKFVSSADCVVLGVRVDGKESVDLGLYDDKGELVPVGRSSLIGKEKRGIIQPGDVIEVRYLYAGANGRLYQPTILHKRTDKTPAECKTTQMKHVNKEVLEEL